MTKLLSLPVIAHRLGCSPRGALAVLRAHGIEPAALVVGLGRFRTGVKVYNTDIADRLKRAAATTTGNRKPSSK